VLHRDVKPNNILVSRFGEPALADFGVSCLLDSNASASVLDVFSPQHAAPELMARGVPSVSSDVYALGSTLYELLTGKPPFGADSRDVRAIMWRAMTEPAPRPDCPELPGLTDAIVRAMAKEPADRFPDAADFAKTLRALVPDGGSATMAMTVVSPAAGAAAASVTSILSAEPETDTGTGPGAVSAAYTGRHTGPQAEPAPVLGLDPDDTFSGRVRGGVDETMVRPDRVDPEPDPKAKKKRGGAAAAGAAGGVGAPAAEGEEGRHRGRKPLIVLVALCLLGGAVWVVLDSQTSSNGAKAEASAHTPIPTKTATEHVGSSASAKPKASASHTATHTAEPTAAKTTHSAAASATATASASSTNSSGGLLGLGTYYQFKSALSGECLTASGSSAGQQSCGGGASQSWEFTEPVTGILNSLAGDFELVDKATGECLDASGGSVGTASCDGGTEQLWSTVGGSSGEEIHNAGDSLCLTSSGSGVVTGACSTSESADLWSQS
jgi:serine/threonine-protein kinase PknK